MANRARDLQFSILSDASKFSTDAPAQDLEHLGDAADTAGAQLDDLERARERLDLDRLGTDAKDTARKVDNAFDAIGRSSKTATRKLDADSKDVKGSFTDIRDEAGDTGREMAASFGGGVDDVLDAFQELGANAATAFGPVGVAAGIAAGAGVGLVRAEAEKLKVLAQGFVDEMTEAGGRLTDAAINNKIQQAASEDPGGFVKQKELVEDLGIAWEDYARAKYGDGEAAERVMQKIADLSTEITENAAAAGSASGEMYAQQTALNGLAGELGLTAKAYGIAKDAVDAAGQATVDNSETIKTATSTARGSWDDLRSSMVDPITGRVRIRMPSKGEFVSARANLTRGIGTIVVPVKPGQSRFTNTADNSRYRE